MKFDLNGAIGFLFLFILTVVVIQSFNEHNEYRYHTSHIILLSLGIAFVNGKMSLIKKKDSLNDYELKKYIMYGCALLSLYYLSQFFIKGYQLWELFGALIFGTQCLLIYLKKW